jgi:hypothetical protein
MKSSRNLCLLKAEVIEVVEVVEVVALARLLLWRGWWVVEK